MENKRFESKDELNKAYEKRYGAVTKSDFEAALKRQCGDYFDAPFDDFDLEAIHKDLTYEKRIEVAGQFPIKLRWVRFSEYQVIKEAEEGAFGITTYIEPTPEAEEIVYEAGEEQIDAAIFYLVDSLSLEIRLLEAGIDLDEGIRDIAKFEEACEDYALDFMQRFGFLGIHLSNLSNLFSLSELQHLSQKAGPALALWYQPESPAISYRKYLQERELTKVKNATGSFLTFQDFEEHAVFRSGYREPVYFFIQSALKFANWAVDLAKLPSSIEPLKEVQGVLGRSNPLLQLEDGRLRLVWEAKSLLDAAYLRVIDSRIKGSGFDVCMNPDCNKLFKITHRNQRYCDHKCSGRARQKRFRDREEE